MFAQQTTIISEVNSSPAPKRSNDYGSGKIISLLQTKMEKKMKTVACKKNSGVALSQIALEVFRGSSAQEIADKAGVTADAVRKWQNGSELSGRTVFRLCSTNPQFMALFASYCGYSDIAAAADYGAKLDLVKEVLEL